MSGFTDFEQLRAALCAFMGYLLLLYYAMLIREPGDRQCRSSVFHRRASVGSTLVGYARAAPISCFPFQEYHELIRASEKKENRVKIKICLPCNTLGHFSH